MATDIAYGAIVALAYNSLVYDDKIKDTVLTWNEGSINGAFPGDVAWARSFGQPPNKDNYTITVLQLSIPEFLGAPVFLRLKFTAATGEGKTSDLRFSLCASSDNRDAYVTSYNPSDPNRVAQTDISVWLPDWLKDDDSRPTTDLTVEIEAAELKPGSVCYLVIQNVSPPSNDVQLRNLRNTIVEIGYDSGLVYINNEAYQCFIGNGGTSGTEADWDLCLPYIGNGGTSGTEADWDLYS